MKKYEYRSISLIHTPSTIAELNELGRKGWKLVGIWGDESTGYLMREVPE